MRLKKLTLQAFGPFKGSVVIDFEKDKIDKGLLLITGDTGAGKTTIFDAICFALYGQTSGETRTANSLRSDWASLDDATFVDLEFYYKNKLYEVKRSPEYERSKKSGTGSMKQPATAELNLDGRTITKVTDVTKEIEKLIGLDYKQFRQVAMLSQGEFTKFLLAPADEKTTIFRKIFGTEFYDNLQKKLKTETAIIGESLKLIKNKIDTEKSNIESIIDVYGLNDSETIDVLTKRIDQDTKVVNETKSKRDKKNDEKTILTTEISNIKKINNDINTYNKSKEELDNLLLNNKDINNDKEKYEYNINVASLITNELTLLNSSTESLEEKKKQELENKKSLDLKLKEYKEKEEKFNNLDNYSKIVTEITSDISKISDKIKTYDTYVKKSEELSSLKEECILTVAKYDKQNNLFETIRKKYYLNISVEIADSLKEGEECPVCGSKNHPKLATSCDSEYTKEDLENAEKELKRIDSIRKTQEARLEEINNTIKEMNISKDVDISKEIEKLNSELTKKKLEKEKLNEEYNILSKEKTSLTSDIRGLTETIEVFKKDIINLENSIKSINIKLENIYKDYNTNYEDYISKKISSLEINDLKNKLDSFDTNKTRLETIINNLKNEVEGKEVVDITEKQSELDKIAIEYKELDDKYTLLNTTLAKLISATEHIKKYLEEGNDIQKKYSIISVLCNTANGTLIGKQRISFENYVQSYFMQSVLVEANKRLIKMTDSRYELKKKEQDIRLNTKGLDFAIFDSYTGKERDVASLSGGEKFKASLALALGLSDTISNNRGGIRIDSLFIDEGFGSLDPESLNQALNILSDLSGNDKLVGVISHVSELLNRIDNKILVNKTNTGSTLKIEK